MNPQVYNYKVADCPPGRLMRDEQVAIPPGIAEKLADAMVKFLAPLAHGHIIFVHIPDSLTVTVALRTTEEVRKLDAHAGGEVRGE